MPKRSPDALRDQWHRLEITQELRLSAIPGGKNHPGGQTARPCPSHRRQVPTAHTLRSWPGRSGALCGRAGARAISERSLARGRNCSAAVIFPFLDEGVSQATGKQHLEVTDFHSVGPPGHRSGASQIGQVQAACAHFSLAETSCAQVKIHHCLFWVL